MAAKTALVAINLIAAQLLLLASAPAMAIPIPPATTTSTTVPSARGDVPALPFPVPDAGSVAEAAEDCWNAVLEAETCAVDVVKWLASPALAGHVSLACCGVLQRVGDRCIRDLFLNSGVGQLYDPFVRHACGIPLQAPAPPSGRQ